LSEVFENNITKEFKAFQKRVEYFALPDLIDYQTRTISLIGNLKEQHKQTKNESFNDYFIRFYDSLKASNKNRVISVDYQIFIGAFNESLIDSLLLKFQILKDTFDGLIQAKKSSVANNEDKLFYVNRFLGRTHGIIASIGSALNSDDSTEKIVMQMIKPFRANRRDYSAAYHKAIKELESLFLDSAININSVKKLIEMKVNENLEAIKYVTPEIGSPMRFYMNHLNMEIKLFFKFKTKVEQIFGQSENTVIKQEGAKEKEEVLSENRTKRIIQEAFETMDKNGWNYAFLDEQDYNLFTDLLTSFFEYKPYALPEKPIQLKSKCKTKLAKALGDIHDTLSNENKLTTDYNFFKLVRVLIHFKNENQNDLYKALTR
jgi:hypothetical protein